MEREWVVERKGHRESERQSFSEYDEKAARELAQAWADMKYGDVCLIERITVSVEIEKERFR